MNNPFSRLKHYLPSEIDPQENHATECLAACLVFSSKIRKALIDFLLNGTVKTYLWADVDVDTQQPIEGGGYIDLLLSQGGKFLLAVEVKVRSPENCDHHRNQLRNYRTWLDKQKTTNAQLFTLVRNEDSSFHPEQYGANGRRTWAALYRRFQTMLRAHDLSETEASLIKNLCDYLESEAIVSTYDPKDLLSYAAGVQASKAINGIFNQITSRLEADGFKAVSIENNRKDMWPQLQIQHPRWKAIFGKGENNKVTLWFCVPGIWEASEYEFYPEIELWNLNQGNDWQFVKSNLATWLAALKSQGFNWIVFPTWNKRYEDMPASDIQVAPKRIVALNEKNKVPLAPNQLQSEDDLVNLLVDRIKQHATIVDSLGK